MSVVLSGGFLAQTGKGCGQVGQAEDLEEVQNGARAFLGEVPVRDSATAEKTMTLEPEKLSKGRQKLEVR